MKVRETIPISKPTIGEEEVAAVEKVLRSGWISQGPKVAEFEKEFAKYVGAKYACAVANCTVALHLALLVAGVKPGECVITVSHSFIATANVVRYCGAEPLFVDIDPATYNISPQALRVFLKENCVIEKGSCFYKESSKAPLKRIGAILAVHQIGMPCDLQAISEIAKEYNIVLIEDAACAIGSQISFDNGKHWEMIGKPCGKAACFSFHPRKVLSTGEGGMITTNDEEWDKKFRLMRQHGMSITDLQRHQANKVVFETYDLLGFNYRMTDIQAAVGMEQLRRLPTLLQERNDIEKLYRSYLQPITWLELPKTPSYARSNWQSYAVRLLPNAPKSRDEILNILFENGIMSKPGIMNAHQELVYKDVIYPNLKESERARKEVILLPLHSHLNESDIRYIVEILGECDG